MRIDYITPAFNTQIPQNAPVEGAAELRQDRDSTPNNQHWVAGPSRPGVIVDISPEGWAAYERNKELEKVGAAQKNSPLEPQECETCKNRRYVDSSNDPSVSFQTPTHISPGQSAAMVSAHENEHVTNEQTKADQEGREVISQTVTLQTSICPECGRVYVSGGTTRTMTAAKNKEEAPDLDNGSSTI